MVADKDYQGMGCYIDALRRARSSRELKRRGKGGRDRPGIRSIKGV